MQLCSVTSVTICLIVHLTASSGPVSMYVRQEANSVNYFYVNFYNDTFQRLYECMTDVNSQQCFVQTAYENDGTPFPGQNNKVANVRSYGTSQLVQSSFTCLFSQQATTLECSRNTGQCGGNTCTSFRLRNYPICECVNLIWQYPNEKLIFDKTDNIEYCKQDCTETTYITTNDTANSSTHKPVTSTLPSFPVSNTTTSLNVTNIKTCISKPSSNNPVAIIIGAVLGVLVVALAVALIVAVVFIYKRKKPTKKHNNTGVRSPGTDNDHNGIATTTIIHRINNSSNIPEELPTLTQGSGVHGESEDGYYSIDKVYTFNTYQNELNINFPHNEQSSRIPHGLITYENEP